MATATGASTLTIRDRVGALNITLALDLASTTPQQVLDHLLSERHIMSSTPQGEPLTYKLAKDDAELALDKPLAEQGVNPGDTIFLLTVHTKG